jgi:hypothetical protein
MTVCVHPSESYIEYKKILSKMEFCLFLKFCTTTPYALTALFISNNLRGPYSASELYRLSEGQLSTKFSANFCG